LTSTSSIENASKRHQFPIRYFCLIYWIVGLQLMHYKPEAALKQF